jgi:hypothetical protein
MRRAADQLASLPDMSWFWAAPSILPRMWRCGSEQREQRQWRWAWAAWQPIRCMFFQIRLVAGRYVIRSGTSECPHIN